MMKPVFLVEETGVPGGNHQPTASKSVFPPGTPVVLDLAPVDLALDLAPGTPVDLDLTLIGTIEKFTRSQMNGFPCVDMMDALCELDKVKLLVSLANCLEYK